MSDSAEGEPTPFRLSKQVWANVDAIAKAFALIPIAVGAVMYVFDAPDREASFVREAWRALIMRPKVQEQYREGNEEKVRDVPARNWGAKPALQALVERKQRLHSIALDGVDLSDAKLSDGQLAWSALRGTTLWNADLEGADLHCADLRGANLREAKLKGANFKGANITGAVFSGNAAGLRQILAEACEEGAPGTWTVIIVPFVGGLSPIPKCEAANSAKPLGKHCIE